MPGMRSSLVRLVVVASLVLLAPTAGAVLGVALASEGAGSRTQAIVEVAPEEQIITQVTPQEAFALLQENAKNRNFHIIELRGFDTCETTGLIDAQNTPVDYVRFLNPERFRDKLSQLDRNNVYLINNIAGEENEEVLAIVAELGFREVYALSGGFDAWLAEDLPMIMVVGVCDGG